MWVADRGFDSAQNRRYLQRAGDHYILGEKLRGESAAGQGRPGPPGSVSPGRRQPPRSRRSSSTTARCATGSSSAATPMRPSVMPRSGGSCSSSWR